MSKFRKTVEAENGVESQEIDILRLLSAIWHRAWLVVVAAILCGAAAFSYATFYITPMYQSSTMLYVNNGSFSLGGSSFSVADLSASKSLVDTYIVLLKTRLTLEEVIKRADLNMSYGTLNGMISASAVNDTEVFRITVTDSDPKRATLIANTIAEVLPGRVEAVMNQSSMRIVDYAVVPGGKSSPNVTKYTSMGLLLGAAAACVLIVIIELLDDRIHDENYLIQNYNLPILASIPDFGESNGKGGSYYKRGYRYSRYGSYYSGHSGEESE